MAGRHVRDEIAAGQDVAPEAVLLDGARKKGGDPDHGNGLVFWVSLHALRVTARRPGARSIGEKPAKNPPSLRRGQGREDAMRYRLKDAGATKDHPTGESAPGRLLLGMRPVSTWRRHHTPAALTHLR